MVNKFITMAFGQFCWLKLPAVFFTLIATFCFADNEPDEIRYITPNPVGTVVFSVGDAQILRGSLSSAIIERGAKVKVGDVILTGPSSHVHIKMIDAAFISVRPDSRLRITEYNFDPAHVESNRVKFELEEGIVRSVTGSAGKLNKAQFRLNTPIAAIGVRGTDFTVYTTPDITRVAVREGGIVVSPFVAGCQSQGIGPCEGGSALDLSAAEVMTMLEVNRDDIVPRRVKDDQTPDQLGPPLPEEYNDNDETNSAKADSASNRPDHIASSPTDVMNPLTNEFDRYLEKQALLREAWDLGKLAGRNLPQNAGLTDQPVFSWGRWQEYHNDDPNYIRISQLLYRGAQYRTVGNSVFALLEDERNSGPLEASGKVSFKLNAYETYIKRGQQLESATVSNPALIVDFDSASFATRLDLTAESIASDISVLGHGNLNDRGTMLSDANSPSIIEGAVSADGMQAGYTFESAIAPSVEAVGATSWVR
jgi:hypothetical protein